MSESERDKSASKPVQGGIAFGLAWFRRDQWPQLLANAADREKLEDTYDEWLRKARQFLLDAAARGVKIEKVDVDIDELVAWCRRENRPLDGEARSSYASYKLLQSKTGK